AMCLNDRAPRTAHAFRQFCESHVRSRTCAWFSHPADAAVKLASQKVLHVSELVEASRACGTCPHKAAMEAARRAQVVVCDYNYVFSDIREKVLPRIERPLEEIVLVVDEAHNLPDRIRSHLTGDLDAPMLIRASKEAKAVDPEAGGHLQEVARSLHQALIAREGERVVEREELIEAVEKGLKGWGYDDLLRASSEAGETLAGRGIPTVLPEIAECLRRWRDAREGVLRLCVGGPGGKFSLRLLDPSILSRRVFEQVHASVLMSGTLHPPAMYADLLGIEPARRVLRAYPNPFPKENRRVLVDPKVTTSYDRRSPSMYAKIAHELLAVVAGVPGNVAAFFPSYEILAAVVERVRTVATGKQLVAEKQEWGAAERGRVLESLRDLRTRGGALLMGVQGGSLSEGVDYAGNLLSAVVIVGFPFSPPTIEVEALKSYYMRKFGAQRGHEYAYVYPAINKILQAAGRCIRSERDRAVVVLLESRLLDPRYAGCFPGDFPLVPVSDVASEVRSFFYGGSASDAPCS
ncbi:MAG TPA: ATP-dependent DNA helicase, partial [Thermoanaerobaculia bacterium]